MLQGTVDRVRFRGAALAGNALGDPVERELIAYLPPSYATSERRYPLVMVLPGFAATNSSLLNFKPWEPTLFERYEKLLARGCGEAILVLPDCFTRLGGSQYVDAPAQGSYQRYLADDVLAFVDARYRTIASREARAIVGKSSGGFGALRMGFDRPERFAVIASHAGDCAFELTLRGRFTEVLPVYEKHGGPAAFLRALADRPPRGQSEFHALEMLALAHAYADGELPVDPYSAELIPARWERWLAADPVVLAEPKSAKTLSDARLVFLDAGRSDEYGLQFGARILAGRLRSAGAAVEHQEFDGGHMGTAYRYDVSLPKVIAALDADARSIVRSRAENPRASLCSRAEDPRASALAEDAPTAHTTEDAGANARGAHPHASTAGSRESP
ncbi:MAG TPA: alpha/beta hydrolase-fold protein [Polyangiales bacterium]|nr:alpha/beta hydrolase-fold protein [Polyangiales bacterium]